MMQIDPKIIATAFVDSRAPSVGDLLGRIAAAPDLTPTRRRDLASGLRRVAKAIGLPPGEIPADPVWLRPRIAAVAPAALGVSPKSWTNAVSDARAALAHLGIVERRRAASTHPRSPAWRALRAAIREDGDPALVAGLGRLVGFLDRAEVAPGDTGDAHLAAFGEALALNGITRAPDRAMRAAARGWNRAIGRIDGWPAQRLSAPSSNFCYALPPGRFPESFIADLDRFVRGMTDPDPLDPEARTAPLRPATAALRRGQVLRFASALVHAGLPAAEIHDLAVLVEPASARRGLSWLLGRNGGRTSSGIAEHGVLLVQIARQHLRLAKPARAEIERMAARLAVPRAPGLTEKNRARLRPFTDRATVRRLLALPGVLARKAAGDPDPRRAARRMEVALAIAILLAAPLRRKNLAGIHLDRTLDRQRGGAVFLVFGAGEMKNRRPFEAALPAGVVELLERHLADHRPALAPPGSRWLFPARSGSGPCDPGFLAKKITATIRREIGIEMNPHLFRHFSALLWLEANPGQYEVARRLLGHAELSSTLNAYAGHEAGTASRLFAELIEAARREPA